MKKFRVSVMGGLAVLSFILATSSTFAVEDLADEQRTDEQRTGGGDIVGGGLRKIMKEFKLDRGRESLLKRLGDPKKAENAWMKSLKPAEKTQLMNKVFKNLILPQIKKPVRPPQREDADLVLEDLEDADFEDLGDEDLEEAGIE